MTNRKRKKKLQEVNGVEPEDEITPEDMDLYVNIEDIEFPDEERRVHESRKFATKIGMQEEILFEEESITLYNAMFDKYSEKLVFDKNSLKKNIQGNSSSKVDLNGIPP
jgi:hypothetical protein